MQTKRRIIAAKIEQAEGTPEVLTGAETGLLVSAAQYTPDVTMLPRNVVLATFSKLPDLPGARMAAISFTAEVIGRGLAYAVGTLPRLSPYLRACGLAETLDDTGGAEKVSYKRANANIPSLTLALLDDDGAGGAVIKKIAGARGNVKLRGERGGALMADFNFVGVYLDVADGAQLVAAYDSLQPPQLLSAQFALAGFAPSVNSFEIDLGNKVAGIPDMNAASGYKAFRITDGDTRGRFDPEMVKVATYDYYGKWKAGIAGALSIGAIGAAQYNKVKITAPKLVTTKVAEGEREAEQIVNVDFQLAMDAGDDELVLEFS
jgi:hypothetical protein